MFNGRYNTRQMPLLTDTQLREALRDNPTIIDGLDTADWTSLTSHIQPCSVDLHIGDIYLPGEAQKEHRVL